MVLCFSALRTVTDTYYGLTNICLYSKNNKQPLVEESLLNYINCNNAILLKKSSIGEKSHYLINCQIFLNFRIRKRGKYESQTEENIILEVTEFLQSQLRSLSYSPTILLTLRWAGSLHKIGNEYYPILLEESQLQGWFPLLSIYNISFSKLKQIIFPNRVGNPKDMDLHHMPGAYTRTLSFPSFQFVENTSRCPYHN